MKRLLSRSRVAIAIGLAAATLALPVHAAPRAVEVGQRAGERVQVLSGVSAGEPVVVSGSFLLDKRMGGFRIQNSVFHRAALYIS